MYDLYTAATPNGFKVSIMLEELGAPYAIHPIDLAKGEQKQPEFLALNPNGRIPALVDTSRDFPVFESGAILLYLAEKHCELLPGRPEDKSEVVQWLMFQMSGVGPMFGQAGVFNNSFPEKLPSVIERYTDESHRLLSVLEGRLADREYLAGVYSIADIATYPWIRAHEYVGVDLSAYPAVNEWAARIAKRPAVIEGINKVQAAIAARKTAHQQVA